MGSSYFVLLCFPFALLSYMVTKYRSPWEFVKLTIPSKVFIPKNMLPHLGPWLLAHCISNYGMSMLGILNGWVGELVIAESTPSDPLHRCFLQSLKPKTNIWLGEPLNLWDVFLIFWASSLCFWNEILTDFLFYTVVRHKVQVGRLRFTSPPSAEGIAVDTGHAIHSLRPQFTEGIYMKNKSKHWRNIFATTITTTAF